MTFSSCDPTVKEEVSTPPKQEHEEPHHHQLHLPHHHHGHNGRQRLLKFVHPHTGRSVHVAHTPEEVENMRTDLMRAESKDDEFDVLLLGSPEHLDAIQSLHAEHSSQQEKLKEEYSEAFEQFETVRNQLDILNDELRLLTDHSVALDASFDKFGYSAHLRTKDHSETSSLNEDQSGLMTKHDDRAANPLKFFKRPQIRQYFHKGLLWRSSRPGEVASFELFIDLVYVGVIDAVGEVAVEHADGLSFLHFMIIFSIAAKVWTDMTMIINWFDIDDIFQRIAVAFYLVCLFGYTTNIAYMFRDGEATYTSALAFYITQRLFLGLWFLMVAFLVPMIKGTMIMQCFIILLTVTFWIGSIHCEWPGQLALIWVAVLVDIFGGILIINVVRQTRSGKSAVSRFIAKYFEFFPAINIEHRVERNNAFVALIFGYSILTILYQSSASFGINAFFGKGILGLLQAFAFNWIYFEIDAFGIHVHAIRRSWISAGVWAHAHVPFIMAYVLAAATLSQLVLAHDCPNAEAEWLGEGYDNRSRESIGRGLRWFYCGGLGASLIFMAIISLCHTHKRLPNAKLRKRPRLIIRCLIAIAIICLPLADSLNSLDLVAITCSLTILILIIDLYGNIREGHSFWKGGLCPKERKKCTYTANCKLTQHRRKELQKAMERGDKVGLKDLLRRHSSLSLGGTTEGGSGASTPKGDEESRSHYVYLPP